MIEPSSNNHASHSLFGWAMLPLAVFPLIAIVTYDWHAMRVLQTPPAASANWIGALGDSFAYYGYLLLGLALWFVPVLCLAAIFFKIAGRRVLSWSRLAWTLIALVALASLVQALQGNAPGVDAMMEKVNIAAAGGASGYLVMSRMLEPVIGRFGATILMGVILTVSLIAAIGVKNIADFFLGLFRWAAGEREAEDDGVTPAPADARRAASEEVGATMEQGDLFGETPMSDKERRKMEKEAAKEAKRQEKEAKRAAKEAEEQSRREAQQRVEAERQAELDALNKAREAAKMARTQTTQNSAPAASAVTAPAAVAAVAVRKSAVERKIEPKKPEPAQAAPKPEEEKKAEDKGPYILPPLTCLAPLKTTMADHGDVGETSQRLVDTLKLFGIDATVSYTVQGPVVTKYALELAPGTRYTAVTGLSDNLMGALRAKSLRIEAPIPGEDRVGMEVPNRAPAGISFREIFESDAWKNSKAELPLLFGKRADGKELVSDLASMPHMLVAGATGQGKSVCLNSLICGLLMTRTPEQLKLIMVDPKCVEFTPYASIPHLLVPVITDNKKVVFSLHWAVAEMEKRLKLFARAHVKNIYDFNHRKSITQTDMFGADTELGSDIPKTVPYIVIIIDEAADLIGQCGKEVNPDIQRITQKARAAGIHLILATQRPDAKIITGGIKANIPGRVAFKTASAVDSRTILDDNGAENLIGKGDMLFKGKDGLLIRAQGAWINDEEIANITAFIEQHANTQFDDRFSKKLSTIKEAEIDIYAEDNEGDNGEAAKAEAQAQREQVKAAADADDFKKAVECVINTHRASTSHFQRQMGWGYNHAAKILDELTKRGIVSEPQGMGPRSIIMEQEQLVAILNGEDNGSAEGGTEESVAQEAGATAESGDDNLTTMEEQTA